MDEQIEPAFWRNLLEMEVRLVTGSIVTYDTSTCAGMLHLSPPNSLYVQDLKDVSKYMIVAEYERVMNFTCLDCFLDKAVESVADDDLNGRLEALKMSIDEEYDCDDSNQRVFSLLILFCGASIIQEFVRCNWTGPMQSKPRKHLHMISKFFNGIKNLKKEAMELLAVDGEIVAHNVIAPELLLLGKTLIFSVIPASCISQQWWAARCLMLQQHILEGKSATLHDSIKELFAKVLDSEVIKSNDNLKVFVFLEAVQMHLYYHEIIPAREYLTKARNMVGMEIEMCSAFGTKTKFQSKPLPQLYLDVKLEYEFPNAFFGELEDLPEDLILDDDVLLNNVKFMNEGELNPRDLGHLEQAVLLAEICLHLKSNACDELNVEQLMAYINCLLVQPNLWCIRITTLLLRCRLERKQSRKVERAMMQLEVLIEAARKDKNTIHQRQCLFYSVQFPPFWNIEKELADLLTSLGAVKSALEIYERLNLWEDIVNCYQILGKNEKAAELVRKRIEEEETPVLWCILGDATNDISCYEKALELSGGKSARAHRSIGYYYYRKKNYKEAIPHFKNAVEMNYLQLHVWFCLAFASTVERDFEQAAKSYRQVVNLDPENYEAWNNLSNAYIKLKQKERAYKTLQEALKCNYENWHIWENFVLVCLDVGAFEDAIHAYHRLLDIRGKYEDVEVLSIIVKTVTSDVQDYTGQSSLRLKSKVLQLFGRVTSITTNNSEIWKLYAMVLMSDPGYINHKETLERVLNYRQKAHKYAVHDEKWVKDESSCWKILSDAIDLADAYLAYFKIAADCMKAQNKMSAKLMLKNVIARVEKEKKDFRHEFAEKVEGQLETLKKKLEEVEKI